MRLPMFFPRLQYGNKPLVRIKGENRLGEQALLLGNESTLSKALNLIVSEYDAIVVAERVEGRNDVLRPVVGLEYCIQLDAVTNRKLAACQARQAGEISADSERRAEILRQGPDICAGPAVNRELEDWIPPGDNFNAVYCHVSRWASDRFALTREFV